MWVLSETQCVLHMHARCKSEFFAFGIRCASATQTIFQALSGTILCRQAGEENFWLIFLLYSQLRIFSFVFAVLYLYLQLPCLSNTLTCFMRQQAADCAPLLFPIILFVDSFLAAFTFTFLYKLCRVVKLYLKRISQQMILLGTQSAQNIITSWVLKDIIQVTKMYAGHFWPFSLGNGYFEGQNNMTRRALFAHV